MITGACRRCATVCFTACDLCTGCAGREPVYYAEPAERVSGRATALVVGALVLAAYVVWRAS